MWLLLKEFGTIDPPYSDFVGPHNEAMIWLAAEVAPPLDAAVVSPIGSSQLHAEPSSFFKVHWSDVADYACHAESRRP